MVKKNGQFSPDVIVVGGGVIGCAIGFFLAKNKVRTLILERGLLAGEASHAASGVILPHPCDGAFDRLANDSFRMFPKLVQELMEIGGIDPVYEITGRLDIALDAQQALLLHKRVDQHARAGIEASWLEPTEARQIEPLLTSDFKGVMHVPQSACISGNSLTKAFAASASAMGVEILEDVEDVILTRDGDRITGVQFSNGGNVIQTETVVLAAGAWSKGIANQARLSLNVHPVKGQNLLLRLPHTVKLSTNVYCEETILVPRPDGHLIAGVTIESSGFDSRTTVDGIQSIMDRAQALLPALSEARMAHAYAGLRPATVDGLPIIGRPVGIDGLIVATGHFRSGIALSPVTGSLVAKHIVNGVQLPKDFDPNRGSISG